MPCIVPPKPPPRSSTLPAQQVPLSDREEGGVVGVNYMATPEINTHSTTNSTMPPGPVLRSPSPPTEDPPEPPEAYEDSEDEEEAAGERRVLVSIQSTRRGSGDLLMIHHETAESSGDGGTPFSSPMHKGTLIQQGTSGSSVRDHEDDIIMMGSFPSNPDYMNQDAIDDETLTNSESDDDGPSKRIIVSKRSDSLDNIMGVGGVTNSDYMNQGTIDDELVIMAGVVEGAKDRDYMNQAAVDQSVWEVDKGLEYMNQEAVDQTIEAVDKALEYMNQEAIDQTMEDTEKALEYMNQAIVDLVHSEIDQDMARGVAPEDIIPVVSHAAPRVTHALVNDGDFYDTEDDLSDDFDDEDEGGGRRISANREPLQIRGTMPVKAHSMDPALDSNKLDYENQDVLQEVLEGDIIPMVIAPQNTAGQPLLYLPPKTQAEVSSNGLMVSHDSWNEVNTTRASWCTDDVEQASSLDFVCDNPNKPSKKVEVGVAGKERGAARRNTNDMPKASLSAPLVTKPRSHTSADALQGPPRPFDSDGQSNNSRIEVDGHGFSRDPFSRDYIPVSGLILRV
jgi:hypothetical protein